jgi:Lysozyme like domain
MSIFNFTGLEHLWEQAGGDPRRAAVMAAIAEAESSGNSGAVSWAGAIGLWQIMPFWAPHFGWPVSLLYDPWHNAWGAKQISGDGYHVGAWDTCYNPPSSAANRRDLSNPIVGSPAYNILRGRGGTGSNTSVSVGSNHIGPTNSERDIMSKLAWANHLQRHAIPDNTQWVADNRRLRKPRR